VERSQQVLLFLLACRIPHVEARCSSQNRAANPVRFFLTHVCAVPALRWQKSASKGNAQALNNLGTMYHNGGVPGVEQSFAKAIYFFREAASRGYAEAQFNLGASYYKGGQGVEKSHPLAVASFKGAAEQEHAGAQFFLAQCFQFGHGVPQDYTAAARWYRRAASNGHATASLNVRFCEVNAKSCSLCHEPNARRVCSRCHSARYCDVACQRRHWMSATAPHKDVCGTEGPGQRVDGRRIEVTLTGDGSGAASR
jgi:TPR repeat protein